MLICRKTLKQQVLCNDALAALACSLGAALAHLYSAALLVPRQSPWNIAKTGHNRFKMLCTQGQPKVGTYEYNRRLENHLCTRPDPRLHRYEHVGSSVHPPCTSAHVE